MDVSVSARELFREFVGLAMRSCQQAEKACPRTGPGRKPVVPDWVIATRIVVAVAARRKTKSAQLRYGWARADELKALGVWPLPKGSAFFERYLRAWRLLQAAIAYEGKLAERLRWADVESVSADKSLIAAQGPPAHRRNGRPCRVRGADLEAVKASTRLGLWIWVRGGRFLGKTRPSLAPVGLRGAGQSSRIANDSREVAASAEPDESSPGR
jgi:hypothetical protein